MKLSKRFLIIPAVLALFSYLFYSFYKDVKDKTLNEFNEQQFTLARQASRGIESFFIYYLRELTFLSKLKNVSDLTDQGKDLLAEFYNSHSDQIEAITLMDQNGMLTYTYPYNPAVIGQDISDQQHIKILMQTHKPTVSDVFTSVQGFRAIAYHIPIIIDNEFKGSIAVLIQIDKLGKRFIESIKTGKTGYGWMISEAGFELYSPHESQTGIIAKEEYKKVPSVLQLINRASTEKGGTTICYSGPTDTVESKSMKTLAGFYRVPLDNTFWTILIFTPEKEVFAKLTSFRNRLFILFALIIIVIGTYFYLSFKASNILKEEKKRKLIEKTLIESEQRFRIMFELSPAGISLVDEKGTLIEVNTAFCNILGYTRKEIKGQNLRLFAPPSNYNEIENNISKILSGKTIIHEVENIKKDGTHCIIELYETLINLPDGAPGILSVSSDVTEKKHSQERMQTLSRALESIGECVSITDHQNKLIFVNRAFCKTYGYSEDEIIGKDVSEFRSPTEKGPTAEKILNTTINGGWNGELTNLRKDGSEFPIELSTSPIIDEDGNPVALIGIAVDITERKKVQDELIRAKDKAEESDRLKSTFLANVSHELRTPLNAIIGFSGLMVDSGPDQDTLQYSQIIQKSGQHLLNLVENIFDITMIESGQIKIKYEKSDMVSVLEEVRDIIRAECPMENKADIKLILNLDNAGEQEYLTTDPGKLKQVLLNLLRNAVKFTDTGYIEFGYTVAEDGMNSYFQFYVRDTGIGIDKTYHDVIFNIFRQVDDTHTRRFGGMGIGLSIAKKIVEVLGGKIWVESEPGNGSVFYFTIPSTPAKNKKDNKKPEDKLSPMSKNYEGKTILIAEDERSNFDFLKILLNRMNINVIWAKDGKEAVALCDNDPSINLVLMDIKMPVMNGYEATRLIKNKRPGLPVIAQTAYAMISDKLEAENAGCDAYLSKPIKISQLKEILSNYL